MTDREKVERHLFRSEGYAHLPAGMRADLLDIIMADVFKPEPVTEAELWRCVRLTAVFVLDDWQGAYARDVVKALRQRRAEMPVVVIACDDGAGPWYAENGVTVLAKEAGAEAVVEAIG